MIDFHSHTLLSDGVLLPTELARRAKIIGYRALAITDHVDASNINEVISQLKRFADSFENTDEFTVVTGVELTHIPPAQIAPMAKEARELGASVVICHGETIAEPVIEGTNLAAIEAGVDILAHPGLITEDECRLAKERGVLLELTSRKGHSLTNGHVARLAKLTQCSLILNTDSHAPSDLITKDEAARIIYGAGLDAEDLRRIQDNAQSLLNKVSR
ncbi:MAG: histidinol phosphate phosphatase domain-containing protein [Proteobacteria bacterium]|nr:histidinol phosphate phosphatase domain-containing protein [Pseudomonadota bacterium]